MARNSRLNSNSSCLLNYNGINYKVSLENVSLDGALLKLNGITTINLKPNDLCDLTLGKAKDLYPTKYACKVVRFDTERVGVQFLGLKGIAATKF